MTEQDKVISNDGVSRLSFLGNASAALVAAASLPILAAAQLVHDRGIHALGRVVEALAQAIEQGSHAGFGAAEGEMRQALAGLQKLETRGAFQAVRLRGQVLSDLVLCLGDELGRGGRSGGTQVGGEVRDREVGFVAYC